MKILFYGNCQIEAICKTLNLNSNKYETCVIKCYDDNVTQKGFTDRLKTTDIIITQPISDNYLGKEFLSTSYVLRNCNPNCKVIILPSYNFKFYYFDSNCNRKITGPAGYHYTNMIECYKQGKSVDYYLEHYVNNPYLKSKQELEKIADDSIKELDTRYNDSQKYKILHENVITISISKFIQKNYKDTFLFHTINHPTKALFHHVCHEILNILQIENTMDYWSDFLAHTIRSIMYKCVEQVISFKQSVPLIDFPNYAYHHDAKGVTEFYYNGYRKLDPSCFDSSKDVE
jgi:hypothetical protein